MRWRSNKGQAAVEAAFVIPLVILLLLVMVAVGYGAAAHLVVVTSAGQGARQGAAFCAAGRSQEEALAEAQVRAEALLERLAGPKEITVAFSETDLLVTSAFTYVPPLPFLSNADGGLRIQHTARYRCN